MDMTSLHPIMVQFIVISYIVEFIVFIGLIFAFMNETISFGAIFVSVIAMWVIWVIAMFAVGAAYNVPTNEVFKAMFWMMATS